MALSPSAATATIATPLGVSGVGDQPCRVDPGGRERMAQHSAAVVVAHPADHGNRTPQAGGGRPPDWHPCRRESLPGRRRGPSLRPAAHRGTSTTRVEIGAADHRDVRFRIRPCRGFVHSQRNLDPTAPLSTARGDYLTTLSSSSCSRFTAPTEDLASHHSALVEQRTELAAVQHLDDHVGVGGHRSGAGHPGDERQLAEEVTRSDPRDDPAVAPVPSPRLRPPP